MAELVESLKRAGLSSNEAVRFAAIYFNEMSGNPSDADDEPDTN